MLRLIIVFVLALSTAPHADDWGVLATISGTMGVQDNRVCIGEGSRSDIGCPATAPYVNPATGNMAIGRPAAFTDTKLTVSDTRVAVELALDGSSGLRGVLANAYGTTAGSHYAVAGGVGDVLAANGTSYLIGGTFYATGYTPSGVTNSGYLMGLNSTTFNRAAGDVAAIYGQRIQYGNYTVSATGTTTNAYGLYITSYMDAGTITNNYGLVIGNVPGTNQYGIYQMGTDDTNYFGGKVGIGTSNPSAALHVKGGQILSSDNDNVASGLFTDNWNRAYLSSNGYIWSTMNASAASANLYLHRHNTAEQFVRFGYGTSGVGSISTNGTSVSYNTTSDYRLKEHVTPMAGALERVALLKPVSYSFKADVSHTTVDGFIAHEVQQVVPYAVTGTKDAVDKDGKPVYQQLDYAKLTPLLTAAVQELKAENEKLRAIVDEQGRAIKALQDKR